jgi:hypothetical protein
MTGQWLKQVESYLWPDGFRRNIWMIVDAARDRRIFWSLREFHLEHYCLYSGPLPAALEAAAPYLVQLDYDDEETRGFLRIAWGNSWGVFLRCETHASMLRRHLRTFLVVRDPAGRRLVFRYYDPRVLRIYLPTCNEEELERLFGPIACFWMEGGTARNLIEFHLNRGSLVQRTLLLETSGSDSSARPGSPKNDGTSRELVHQGLLTMRQEQMAAFSRAEVEKFESWMLNHLLQSFPRQCGGLREAELRELIRYGIKRARVHQITSANDVSRFIDLMAMFGRDFDTDEQRAWASQILANRKTARSKLRALYEAAGAHSSRP